MRYMRSFCLQPSALTTSESADFANPAPNWFDACDMRSSTTIVSQVGPGGRWVSPCDGGFTGALLPAGGCEVSAPPATPPDARSTHLAATAATAPATAGVLVALTCACRRLTPAQSLLPTSAMALRRFSSTALVSAARNTSVDDGE